MEIIGIYSIPIIIAFTGVAMLFSKKDLLGEFIKGSREGFAVSLKILPSLILLICATRMFSASGAMTVVCDFLGDFTRRLGIPDSVIPVVIMRPLSGSAATATANNLFSTEGPDSFAGRLVSILMGSSDTIIYTLGLYFTASGIKRTRYALPASFLLLACCLVYSILLTKAFFY